MSSDGIVRWDRAAWWRPLPEAWTQPFIIPTQGIAHTVVGRRSPFGYFERTDNHQESHTWIGFDGALEQFVGFERSADANYRANRRPDGTGALSVETEDDGTPEDTPWTPVQELCLAELMAWTARPDGLPAAFLVARGVLIRPIPLKVPASPAAPGWGWHSLYPGVWSNVRGKTCPARERIAQFPGVLELAESFVRPASVFIPSIPSTPEEEADEMAVRPRVVRNPATQEIALFDFESRTRLPFRTVEAARDAVEMGWAEAWPAHPGAAPPAALGDGRFAWRDVDPSLFDAFPVA